MHISIQMKCHVDIISKTFYMVNKISEMLYIVAALLYEKRPDSTCLLMSQIYMFAVTHFNNN